MFVFGDEASSARRFGPVTIAVLAAVAVASATAVLWHPGPRRDAATPGPSASFDALTLCRLKNQETGLQITLYDSDGPTNARQPVEGSLRWEAQNCGPLVADDPDRLRLADPWLAGAKAEQINSGVDRALCPVPADCVQARPATGDDVDAVRAALRELGHPDAKVRLAEPRDGVALETVVYGVPLDQSACLVAYARIGLGVVRLPPVGRLRSGACLHP